VNVSRRQQCVLEEQDDIDLITQKSARVPQGTTGARAALPQNCPLSEFRGFGMEDQGIFSNQNGNHRGLVTEGNNLEKQDLRSLVTS
jgi:hypothetical protein